MTEGRRQARILLERREAPAYGNPATTACLFPSAEPSALPAISSVFIYLSACVLLYLLMWLSLSLQMPPQLEPVFLKTDTACIFLPGAGRARVLATRGLAVSLGAGPRPVRKSKNSSPDCTVLYSLHFSVPRVCLIISLPCSQRSSRH